ncbi:MAG: hypothetical protein F6K39_46610 [Okeania sp. SIO3B3]|nr:hypothetical protein [Okeania sp. SIO3B3]
MSSEKSQERIGKFIKFLLEESKKLKSSIFPEIAWQKLSELDESLAQVPNEDLDKIDDAILDWLENNQYTSIQEALQSISRDPDDDQDSPSPDPRDQPITNTSLRSAIQVIVL